MVQEQRVYLMNVDLLYPSIERIGNLDADGIDISNIFHCDGLFLCTTKDKVDRTQNFLPQMGQVCSRTREEEKAQSLEICE